MAGAGTHLHRLIRKWTGQDYKPGCGCRALVAEMDGHPPQWSLDHIKEIVGKIRAEARSRHILAKWILAIPAARAPIRWLVKEAVRLAKEDAHDT